jgi:hypothetical protein
MPVKTRLPLKRLNLHKLKLLASIPKDRSLGSDGYLFEANALSSSGTFQNSTYDSKVMGVYPGRYKEALA